MAKIKFSSSLEEIITLEEFPLKKALATLKGKKIAVLGYGIQGSAQALNLRDNGIDVIVGQRKESASWEKAISDDWIENQNLFSIKEATQKAEIILYLLSDTGQKAYWKKLLPFLSKGKTLYFSHGFSIVFQEETNIIPPKDIDVVMIAPKGSGTSLRKCFLEGNKMNSSIAIYQNFTGKAEETAAALGISIGSGYLFKTTFPKEVYADLTGERGVLVGALAGIFDAQYQTLRENGHSASEAFNETVEELTQGLIQFIGENGMDYLFANISTTAQRGALDWKDKFRDATLPVFQKLYKSVKSGNEARIILKRNSESDYQQKLEKELQEIKNSEIWQTGRKIRTLRH